MQQSALASSASLPLSSILELSIVIPCLNEAETIAQCVKKAQQYLLKYQVQGEVIVADNGSMDGSQAIAQAHGARVVQIKEPGYGNALRGGFAAAQGEYIIMGDGDDSYDFTNLTPFLQKLRSGYDLVMGNRFLGEIKPGAMPLLHRYLGNPVLSWIGRLFFRSSCGDFHCGLRGFRKSAIESLDLRTSGMEFASEMIVKAALYRLSMTEVPTTLSPDGRSRAPHLKTWRDGWRHLRFLLLYSPRWLFLYPGLLLMLVGFVSTLVLLMGPRVHSLLYSAIAIIIGFQIVSFGIFTKTFAISEGLLPEDHRFKKISKYVNLESGLIFGCAMLLLGISGSIYSLRIWEATLFGSLNPVMTMRVVIPSVTSLALGVQVIFSSFFFSVLRLKTQRQ
jgi:glycosyltransferase involved in cell wall biosynthesis